MKKTYLIVGALFVAIGLSGCASTQTSAPASSPGQSSGATTAPAPAGQAPAAAPMAPSPKPAAGVVYFETASSALSREARALVGEHAKYVATNPNVRVSIEGHADERGSSEYNLALAERRAETVEQVFGMLKAPADRVSIVSYGEERPAANGHDERSWSRNRRVEFVYR